MKDAATVRDFVIVILQVGFVEVQSKPQRLNLHPLAGFAVSVTTAPFRVVKSQTGAHLIPLGELVTVPVCSGLTPTLSVGRFTSSPANANDVVARARTPTSHATRITEWYGDPHSSARTGGSGGAGVCLTVRGSDRSSRSDQAPATRHTTAATGQSA